MNPGCASSIFNITATHECPNNLPCTLFTAIVAQIVHGSIPSLSYNLSYARILKAYSHSHSLSGGSIWASLECQCCFWIAGGLVAYLTMWLLTFQLFKNSTDTQEKIRLNLHSLSVSELLEYGCKCITICKRILQKQIIIYAISNNALSHLYHQWSKRNVFKGNF
jgi:hypothetical protein